MTRATPGSTSDRRAAPSGAGDVPTTADSARRPWGEPGPSALPALDGLRALAVLAVLLTHVGFQTGRTVEGTVGAVLSRLDIGVTLFFLLSGFLLYRPFAAAHVGAAPAPRLRAYLRNRALRILPAYWLLVVVAVPLLSPRQTDAGELARQLLLLQTVEADHLLHGLTQTWSLVVEAAHASSCARSWRCSAAWSRSRWRGSWPSTPAGSATSA